MLYKCVVHISCPNLKLVMNEIFVSQIWRTVITTYGLEFPEFPLLEMEERRIIVMFTFTTYHKFTQEPHDSMVSASWPSTSNLCHVCSQTTD